eukprot:ctg_1369.g256
MRVVNAHLGLLSDAEMCWMIRSAHDEQQRRVDAALEEARVRARVYRELVQADDLPASGKPGAPDASCEPSTGLDSEHCPYSAHHWTRRVQETERRLSQRLPHWRTPDGRLAYRPRACDSEIILLSNFGSGLQFMSAARQQRQHLLALQARLGRYLAASKLSATAVLQICNQRPETPEVLHCCLAIDAHSPHFTEAWTPVEEQDVLAAVAECLPPHTDFTTVDEHGRHEALDPRLSQPLPYASVLGEARTRLDAEMDRLERKYRGIASPPPPTDGRLPPGEQPPDAQEMQLVKEWAAQTSAAERAERATQHGGSGGGVLGEAMTPEVRKRRPRCAPRHRSATSTGHSSPTPTEWPTMSTAFRDPHSAEDEQEWVAEHAPAYRRTAAADDDAEA